MATYPIKVLLDRHRQPFIPFATTSSIVENGTNRRLDKMLGNLDDLQTNNKNSLVSAINEVLTQHGGGGSSTGWQVVNELPTENISATTIYLVPKEGAQKPNIYEEWVWVNEDWENIGTTEIDLSGYATTTMIGDLNTLQTTDKDCIVDAINELANNVGNIPTVDLTNYAKVYQINSGVDTTVFQNILTDYKNGIKSFFEILNGDYQGLYYLDSAISNTLTFRNTKYIPGVSNDGTKSSNRFWFYAVTIQFKDDYTYSKYTWARYNDGLVAEYLDINTDYTVPYTPLYNGSPATKKYVDDTVAAAGAGSGSAFDPAKYLAIDNTTEYTPTDLYHPATKAYVDSQIASVPEPVDAYSKTEVDGKLANYLSKTNTESYTPTSDYHPATKKFVESVVASINIPNVDLTGYYTKAEVYNKQEIDTKLEDLDVYTKGEVDSAIDSAIDELDFTKYYTKTETDNKFMNYLAKDNTITYTPTLDYHPTTKKYVDDSVSEAVNNIEHPTTDLSEYYTKDDIQTLLDGYNTRFVYDDYQGNTVFTDSENLTITWDFHINRDKIFKTWGNVHSDKTNNKLVVFTVNPLIDIYGRRIDITFSYTSNTGVRFGEYYDCPQFYYIDDEGVEQRVGAVTLSDSTIDEIPDSDSGNIRYTYHYFVDFRDDYGMIIDKEVYMKRYEDITALAATHNNYYATFEHPYISAKVLV